MATKTPGGPVPPAFVVKVAQRIQAGLVNASWKLAPPFVKVLDLGSGFWRTRMIHAAAKLNLADHLKHGARTADDLARETGSHAESLYRLMRTLASLGIFTETAPRTFATTPAGKTLENDHPQSVKPLALLVGTPLFTAGWEAILYSIETGEPSFPHVLGKPIFEYLQEHPEEWQLFNAWMTRVNYLNGPAIAASYPFSRFRRVVDVGGGQGGLLAHILRRHPSIAGVLYDLPDVVKNPVAIDASLASRCEIIGGSFFTSVPAGADLYVMQQIIHDWDDERAVTILRNCREAMAPGGRVLVVDAVIQPGDGFDINKMLDLQMLFLTGGRERTEAQFRALLQLAGLRLVKIHATAAMLSVVEAAES